MQSQFQWDDRTKGLILSSFFIGYMTTQVIGGLASEMLNGKVVLVSGVALWSCFTILTPIAARYSSFAVLLIVRVLMGAGEGMKEI